MDKLDWNNAPEGEIINKEDDRDETREGTDEEDYDVVGEEDDEGEGEEDEEQDIIEFIGEDGKRYYCSYLLSVEHENNTYVAVGHDSEPDEGITDVVILKVVPNGKMEDYAGELYSSDIDEDVYEAVSGKVMRMLESENG